MAGNKFCTLETAANILAQNIAIKLNAWSVNYDLKTGTYKYYTEGQEIFSITKKDLQTIVKREINKKRK